MGKFSIHSIKFTVADLGQDDLDLTQNFQFDDLKNEDSLCSYLETEVRGVASVPGG